MVKAVSNIIEGLVLNQNKWNQEDMNGEVVVIITKTVHPPPLSEGHFYEDNFPVMTFHN